MKILLVASLIIVGFFTEVHAADASGDKTKTTESKTEETHKSIDRELAAMRANDHQGTTEVQVRKERRPVGKQNF